MGVFKEINRADGTGVTTFYRLDNSKGYWKDNIRLADKYIQARNKTNNVVNMELAEEILQLAKFYNIYPFSVSP